MAKLTTKTRKALPKSDFAGSGRSYPVEDRRHAGNAKARAAQAEKAGRMSKAEENRIDAKADRVLGKSKSTTSKAAAPRATASSRKAAGRGGMTPSPGAGKATKTAKRGR